MILKGSPSSTGSIGCDGAEGGAGARGVIGGVRARFFNGGSPRFLVDSLLFSMMSNISIFHVRRQGFEVTYGC